MAVIDERILIFLLQILICLLVLTKHGVKGAGSVTDVTSQVGLSNIDGVIAAFCDFDSDRDTDILVIRTKGNLVF